MAARVEWHHVVPKSAGGRETVALHPICHRAIHAAIPNRDLARIGQIAPLQADVRLAAFLRWIADKPPDFHAPTKRPK